MATAANLSPSSKHFGEFSRYQFEHRPQPIDATYTGADGWQSTGISYDDYRGMHLEKKKRAFERRLETPNWAVNDSELRDVLVRYLELRANVRKPQTGTPEERIARAKKRILDSKARQIEILDKNCAEYVRLKAGECAEKVQQLGRQIESMDTEIRLLGNEDKIAAGVIYRYYRLGEDSVAVGMALSIKPPHVRQLLWRLHKAAARMVMEKPVKISMRINMLRGMQIGNPLRVPGDKQRQCWQCGSIFTPVNSLHMFCKKPCRRQYDKEKKRKKRADAGAKHQSRRFFCSTQCKETGINIKKVMVTFKPGIGQFVPPPNGDSYDTYVQYCKVIGLEPITRDQWGLGGVFNRDIPLYKKKYQP